MDPSIVDRADATAKYSGWCHLCDKGISKGAWVNNIKGRWVHHWCAKGGVTRGRA